MQKAGNSVHIIHIYIYIYIYIFSVDLIDSELPILLEQVKKYPQVITQLVLNHVKGKSMNLLKYHLYLKSDLAKLVEDFSAIIP